MSDEGTNALLEKWQTRVKRHQLAHRFASKALDRINLFLGVPAVVLSTLVATSVFASLEANVSGIQRIIVGLFSVSAAILTALQTFLKLDESSESHQKADAKYAAIKERIEQKRALQSESDQDFFNAIREDMRELSQEAPLVNDKYWKKARTVLSDN